MAAILFALLALVSRLAFAGGSMPVPPHAGITNSIHICGASAPDKSPNHAPPQDGAHCHTCLQCCLSVLQSLPPPEQPGLRLPVRFPTIIRRTAEGRAPPGAYPAGSAMPRGPPALI